MGEINVSSAINIADLIDNTCCDNDNVRIKNLVGRLLIENQQILKAINNPVLEQFCDDENNIDGENYFWTHIKPYYILDTTITDVKNYICYKSKFSEIPRFNKSEKYGQLIFYILCSVDNIEYCGGCRHDIIAHLITDIFNWSHYFDTQLQLVSDDEDTVDGTYACRILTFQFTKPNSILQTRRTSNPDDGNALESKVINKNKGLPQRKKTNAT